jgi:hypothetical protein
MKKIRRIILHTDSDQPIRHSPNKKKNEATYIGFLE